MLLRRISVTVVLWVAVAVAALAVSVVAASGPPAARAQAVNQATTPANVVITAASGELTVSWDRVNNVWAYRVIVWRGRFGSELKKACDVAPDTTRTSDTLSCSVEGLVNERSYNVQVGATSWTNLVEHTTDPAGDGFSNSGGWATTAIYQGMPVTGDAPDAPTDVTGTAGPESVFVTWVAPDTNGGGPITSGGFNVTASPDGEHLHS